MAWTACVRFRHPLHPCHPRPVNAHVVATHSAIIMAHPGARIYVLSGEEVREVPYQETEHYLVTRGFLANPGRTLDELLSDGEGPIPGPSEDGGGV